MRNGRKYLRRIICGCLLAAAAQSAACADTQPYHAGVARIQVDDATPFEIFIAYPTDAAESHVEQGSFSFSAAADAPVASARFPVVLFSHGNGRGGTPLVHAELLLHLAREGFIIVAPFHAGTKLPFVTRPGQIRKALEAVFADTPLSPRADADRVGMMSFSFGGAVTLLSAGARLDLAHLSDYCSRQRDDPRACDGIPTDGSWANIPSKGSADALHLKALVLMEPYGAPFARGDLESLDMPILIYSAMQSDLNAEGNTVGLAKVLPRPPQQVAVPGGHFVFVDPCPAALQAAAPEACDDPPGTDRAAIHERLKQEIADFLRASLAASPQ